MNIIPKLTILITFTISPVNKIAKNSLVFITINVFDWLKKFINSRNKITLFQRKVDFRIVNFVQI